MRSPLPSDHHRRKKVDVLKVSKKHGGECLRYFLTPKELEEVNKAYAERRYYDGPAPRRCN